MHLSDALRNCSIFIKRHLVSGVAKTLRWFGWVLIFQLLVRIVDFFCQLSAFTAKTLADGADESRNVCRIQSGIWTRSKPGFGTAILLTAALRHLLLSLDGCSSLGALMLGCWAWGMTTSSVRFGSSTFEPWVREFSSGFENPCWNPGFDFYIRTLNSETPYSKPGVPNPGVPEPREIEYRKNCKFWTLNTNPNPGEADLHALSRYILRENSI